MNICGLCGFPHEMGCAPKTVPREKFDELFESHDRIRKQRDLLVLQNDALKRLEAVVRYEHEGSCKSPSCAICLELQGLAVKRVEPVPIYLRCERCDKPLNAEHRCK